ncbi:MAG: pseudouridine synthase [Alphaproteobacteria bacterium]
MEAKPERIAKRMSALGLCSRRDAERWIEEGRVAVNGKKVTTPATLVTPEDVLSIDGKEIEAAEKTPEVRMWKYHKPAGLVTTHKDEKGRDTVFDHLPQELPRVVSVGRLDLNSEGLLLLTTSGELSRALELPKNAMARVYRARVGGELTREQLQQIGRGLTVEGVRYQPIRIAAERGRTEGRNRWYELTLSEGKNREIRKIFMHFGIPVSRLIRVRYGKFELGKLVPGQVEKIPQWQVDLLMKRLMGAGAPGGEDAPATAPPRFADARGSPIRLRKDKPKHGTDA